MTTRYNAAIDLITAFSCSYCNLSAGRADAEQEHFMTFSDKAWRSGLPFIQGATGQLEKTVAGTAVKMVVMFLIRSFVQRACLGMMYRHEPSALHQELEIAVDGGLVERFHHVPADFKNFLNPQRPVLPEKHLLNSISLNGFSFHPF
jgi:hypothetical protein